MKRFLARSLVFFTSAAVLVIEILAARLLAPYLGVSLEVWTGIIGVILAGISIGAWLGGYAADRGDPRRLPGPLLVAGGLAALASPLVVDAIGPALSPGAAPVIVGAFLGFFAPAAILSAIPPVIVKIQLGSLDETGRVVGSYSAIGTAGAILGTFVTGFVLVAAFPTRPIIAGLGVILAVTGVVVWSTGRSWALLSVGATAVLALALLAFEGPCQYETAYSCAIIRVDESHPTGRTLILDRIRNSYVDLEDPTYLEFRYIQLIVDMIETEAPPGGLDAVFIGGGGFTLPDYVEHTRPSSDITVLEIDSKLVEVARAELGLDDGVEVIVADARTSLRNLPTDHADVIVGDAYSGASVPWHLTTEEFTTEIDRVLSADGMYVMNVIDYDDLDFIRSEAATLQQVFGEVALFAPPDYLAGRAGGNFVLVASPETIDVRAIEAAIRSRGGAESGIRDDRLDDFIADGRVLTDDFAPVDQMLGRP